MLVFECLNVDLNLNVSLSVSSLNFAAMSISTSLYVFLPFCLFVNQITCIYILQ